MATKYEPVYRMSQVADDVYRYSLTRQWDAGLFGDDKKCVFIMFNASTADGENDDPTVCRCVNFAKREGCNTLEVVNVFAWRTPYVRDIKWNIKFRNNDVVGPENEIHILRACESADLIICAWGSLVEVVEPLGRGDHRQLVKALKRRHFKLYCLGTTVAGHPRHPLYVLANKKLEAFSYGGED